MLYIFLLLFNMFSIVFVGLRDSFSYYIIIFFLIISFSLLLLLFLYNFQFLIYYYTLLCYFYHLCLLLFLIIYRTFFHPLNLLWALAFFLGSMKLL
jgi:hypothetical protein